MNVQRFYIQKGKDAWDDLWVELVDRDKENPMVMICENGEDGKINILPLSIPSLIRFIKAGDQIINNLTPLVQNVHEPENDQVDNH